MIRNRRAAIVTAAIIAVGIGCSGVEHRGDFKWKSEFHVTEPPENPSYSAQIQGKDAQGNPKTETIPLSRPEHQWMNVQEWMSFSCSMVNGVLGVYDPVVDEDPHETTPWTFSENWTLLNDGGAAIGLTNFVGTVEKTDPVVRVNNVDIATPAIQADGCAIVRVKNRFQKDKGEWKYTPPSIDLPLAGFSLQAPAHTRNPDSDMDEETDLTMKICCCGAEKNWELVESVPGGEGPEGGEAIPQSGQIFERDTDIDELVIDWEASVLRPLNVKGDYFGGWYEIKPCGVAAFVVPDPPDSRRVRVKRPDSDPKQQPAR